MAPAAALIALPLRRLATRVTIPHKSKIHTLWGLYQKNLNLYDAHLDIFA